MMMKKTLSLGALLLAMTWGMAWAGGDCPMHVPGAKINVTKIDSGVVVHVTGTDAETVAKIQAAAGKLGEHVAQAGCKHCAGKKEKEAAAPAPSAAVYTCAMGDYTGPMTKDGRCPKCGMKLEPKR